MSYIMTKIERIEGEMVTQVSYSKLNRHPLKVYVRQKYPNDGMEALFTGGEKVLINPNGFPWFNIRLSPLGNLARENQHHTILESGYDHVMKVLEHIITKYEHTETQMLAIEKDTVWDQRPVWKLKLRNPYYEVGKYEMQKNETVMQVARREMLSEYWLVEQNKVLKTCNDVKPGAIINMPNDYAPSMELYIDKERYVPMVMKIYDNQGLFEHYSYSDVTIDPVFEDEEFHRDYPGYGF